MPCEITVIGGLFFGLCVGFILTTLYDKSKMRWAKYWQRWHEKENDLLKRGLEKQAQEINEFKKRKSQLES